MWPGFSRSTLLTAITTGTPSAKTRWAMKRSPAPIRSRQSTTNSTRVDVLERRVDGALHALGERVERPLEAGQVGEHELVVVAVRDPEDPPARRLRLVGDDRHLAAAERVDERRLADVRPARDGDEADFTEDERVRQQLVRRVLDELAVVVRVDDPVDLELDVPLPAAAARRRGDHEQVEVARPVARP